MMLTAKERGDMAEALLPVAANLSVLVHGDGGPEDVQAVLDGLDEAQRTALIVVLAGLVDPDQPMGAALGWLDQDEHGALTVPAWNDRRTVRDLAPEPELEDADTYVDQVAVRQYLDGRSSKVSPRERLEAIAQGVRQGMAYPEFDRMHGLKPGSTSTFISRTRRAYEQRGEVFPELERPAAGRARLSDEQVLAIRERYARGGTTDLELSMQYGVARETVTNVVSGVRYRHVGGPIRPKRSPQPSVSSRVLWAGGQEGFLKDAV